MSAPLITDEPVDVHPIQLSPENVENVAGHWITNHILLQAAHYYARNGRPVFPCCPWDGAFANYKGEQSTPKRRLTAATATTTHH